MTFLYKADPQRGPRWAELFALKAPHLPFRMWPDVGNPSDIRFLATWEPPDCIAERFPNLRILFSTGAGVDQLDTTSLPVDLPVIRMIEPGITDGMVEYVSFAVLALHRDIPAYLRQQREALWQPLPVRTARLTRVGVMGMGVLGQAVLQRLALYGFECAGWSRSRHDLAEVQCFAGVGELDAFLARTDILVCLLPLTRETRHLLGERVFAQLPRGARLVQVGRGRQLVAPDLFAALESGQISEAILDVCDPEPLPSGDECWAHPRIWVTPHIASVTQPDTAVDAILENLQRFERGEPLMGAVERSRGY
jgi:glyoxylate/hydroxypyruvate reductase A